MIEYYPEFFNDVFGPIMQPGSSSHTAGPCRIGYLAHQLLQSSLKHVLIELDKNGSFVGTFGHMNEDLGMLAGAYGLLPDDKRIFDIRQLLIEDGISYCFEYVDFPPDSHPNVVRFVLTDVENNSVILTGNSTGGGMIETVQIMGIPYRFVGDAFLTCISFKDESDISSSISKSIGILEIETLRKTDGEKLYLIRSEHRINEWSGQLISKNGSVLFQLDPILPVVASKDRKKQLFTSFEEWISFAKVKNISLSEAAVIYEKNASGWTKEHIRKYMRTVQHYMERQTQAVYEDDSQLINTPYSGYHYAGWRKYKAEKAPLAGTVIAQALHYAFGVQALIKGVKLVPGPMGTGGGYLYAAMRAVKEAYACDDEAVLDGLFVAAGVGAISYTRTNPTGEMLGCTGECGICGAMAAAGITQMVGGTPEQVEAAASLTLQAALGWPCDPIPGGHNQPCMSRVLTAVTMAITFADIALSGRKAVIPFHEVIDEADAMGKQMSNELKCTSCGGLCETPTGKQCRREFEQWRQMQR